MRFSEEEPRRPAIINKLSMRHSVCAASLRRSVACAAAAAAIAAICCCCQTALLAWSTSGLSSSTPSIFSTAMYSPAKRFRGCGSARTQHDCQGARLSPASHNLMPVPACGAQLDISCIPCCAADLRRRKAGEKLGLGSASAHLAIA